MVAYGVLMERGFPDIQILFLFMWMAISTLIAGQNSINGEAKSSSTGYESRRDY